MPLHYFLSIPLPKPIRSKLASFCYGLPQVQWNEEENFHLIVRDLGPLENSHLEDIQERLESLFFTSFSLILQGVSYFHSKGQRGIIGVGVRDNSSLVLLKKEIHQRLRYFLLPSAEYVQSPITLGSYKCLNPQKLSEYLTFYADYQSEPIEVKNCLLIHSQITLKRIIYQTIESYPARSIATGHD